MAAQNDALARAAGAVNTINPLAWIVKGVKDVPVRVSETFVFLPQGEGLRSVDARMLQHDCHHYDVTYVKNERQEVRISVKLYDWPDVWSTTATIEFAITEDV